MPNLSELIDRTTLKKTKFAEEAKISVGYLYAIMKGRPISRAYAQRIANVINNHLKTNYTIDDINDINLSSNLEENND